jgi:hypothetical protein
MLGVRGSLLVQSRDRAGGPVTVYWLNDRGIGVRIPVEPRTFSSPFRPDRFWGRRSQLFPLG